MRISTVSGLHNSHFTAFDDFVRCVALTPEGFPEWYGVCRTLTRKMSVEIMPLDCERISYSGFEWLITMER
jgi:hypothetical protein